MFAGPNGSGKTSLFDHGSALAQKVYLIDNSFRFRLVLEVEEDQVIFKTADFPVWFLPYLPARYS